MHREESEGPRFAWGGAMGLFLEENPASSGIVLLLLVVINEKERDFDRIFVAPAQLTPAHAVGSEAICMLWEFLRRRFSDTARRANVSTTNTCYTKTAAADALAAMAKLVRCYPARSRQWARRTDPSIITTAVN